MKQSALINDLQECTHKLIGQAEALKSLTPAQLNARPAPQAWSALECLEHLNLYGDFYLKELETRIINAPHIKGDPDFKSGWFGEKTVTDMLPKEGGVRKMKTFKDKDPIGSELSVATVDRFIKQQQQLIRLLDLSRQVNLRKVSTKLTLPLLRFRLGTTFRFVVYHNQRHMVQAMRALDLSDAE